MPPRPRVLLLAPLPPPVGGISTWALGVLASPLAERFELDVLNVAPLKELVPDPARGFRSDRALHSLGVLARLVATMIRRRPAVVHVNTPFGFGMIRDGLAILVARAFGARTVLHLHGGLFPEFAEALPGPLRRLLRTVLRASDCVIPLTGATRTFLEAEIGPERVRQIPNFVRLEDLGAPPARAGRTKPVEILFVGWIVDHKGVRELLEAARDLDGARVTLIGPPDPDFVAELRPAFEAAGERVRLLPARARADLAPLYGEADVFVLPTWHEGFPNVVLEAMAAGLPVVATPVGAIPDAIRDGEDGLLVPVRDPAALRAALARLAADAELRIAMGARGRARVEALFTLPRVAAQLGDLYDEILARR